MADAVNVKDISSAPIEEVKKVEFLTMSHLDRMSTVFLEKLAKAVHLVVERRKVARNYARTRFGKDYERGEE